MFGRLGLVRMQDFGRKATRDRRRGDAGRGGTSNEDTWVVGTTGGGGLVVPSLKPGVDPGASP